MADKFKELAASVDARIKASPHASEVPRPRKRSKHEPTNTCTHGMTKGTCGVCDKLLADPRQYPGYIADNPSAESKGKRWHAFADCPSISGIASGADVATAEFLGIGPKDMCAACFKRADRITVHRVEQKVFESLDFLPLREQAAIICAVQASTPRARGNSPRAAMYLGFEVAAGQLTFRAYVTAGRKSLGNAERYAEAEAILRSRKR